MSTNSLLLTLLLLHHVLLHDSLCLPLSPRRATEIVRESVGVGDAAVVALDNSDLVEVIQEGSGDIKYIT